MPVDPDAEALFATKAEVSALSAKIDSLTSNVTASVSELKAADTALKQADAALDSRLDAVEAGGPVTPPVEPPVTPPPVGSTSFPGDVKPTSVRWGAAYGGNTAPGNHYGGPPEVRRTYFSASNQSGAITIAKGDCAAGTIPWLSFKTNGWARTAAGTDDALWDKLLKDLDAIGKPIWLTFHHEPEGSGQYGTDEGTPTDTSSIDNWKNMQKKIRQRITSTGVKNIAFASCLMAWTWEPASNRKPDYWTSGMDGVWDFFGIDMYDEKLPPIGLDGYTMWKNFKADMKAKGWKYGIGEWGVTHFTDKTLSTPLSDSQQKANIRREYNNFVADPLNIGACYFDTDLNSSTTQQGGWTLTPAQLAEFNAIMASNQPASP